ncbi:type IV secretion system protein VirD4 [Actinoplanes sp. ATCC 53533]|uniref:type IV secretory system conjugative DNA transfer family protein n=1 Tax=Actinoplanes sp. ATCC 53533 TaxID=1288362 RepID=UPI000F78B279|nr:TraM recognition domain-containing protein [Actinoplanes sp. ATCC 53533]RSM59467.1 type IV secretion system protein VirD4 [Actinoplanes sp. ATCC 53533]
MLTSKTLIRTTGAGLVLTAAGWLLAGHPGHRLHGAGLILAGLTIVAGPLWWQARATGSAGLIGRWDRHARRNAGTASRFDIWRTSSGWAMRRKAAVIRPSLAGLSWWRRWRAPLRTFAVPLAKAGRQTVWTSGEESTLRIGIPGTGKTAELANRVIDAPGGVVITSTATDLFDLTAPLRRKAGPVQVFNPGGLGGLTSSLRWSPLSGCTDPATAARRATDLIGPIDGQGAEGARWAAQARRVLAVWLHAAALGDYRMAEVQAWCADPDTAREAILTALKTSPQAAAMRQAAAQSIDMSARTRDGVMLAMAPALAWTTLPSAAQVGDPEPDAAVFTVAELTDHRGALYLLGDDDGTVGPLVAALVAEIAYQARRTAAARPGGRLDPGLTLALDEVALVCPTPLDKWMAELRKRSIVIHAACQGLGQLRERWGKDGASMILNSAAAVLVYGGCKDAEDLRAFADLAGDREETTDTRDADGRITSSSTRRVPVIAPAMLAGLPNFQAMLIRRGMRVALVRTPIVWKRRDLRRAAKPATTRPAKPVRRKPSPQPRPATAAPAARTAA